MWMSNDVTVVLSLCLAFGVVFLSVPSIVKVSNVLDLFDKPGQRKSHTRNIPNLGGIATFAAIVITLALFANLGNNRELVYLFASMTILFFIGIKDDILIIAPNKKLIGELVAALILVVLGNIRFTSLHGFLGIEEINYITSILLTTFVMVVIINAFNLIDGIDGLASGLGSLVVLTFGVWFYLTGNQNYAILCASIAGAYISFFSFNVFGNKNKIFMGDTGSLLLGLLISIVVIRFNEDNITYTGVYSIQSAPAVSFGILIVPMFDTLRVFLIRIIHGQSPFHADKNHVHHRLLLLGFSHVSSTVIITSVNALFIVIMLSFNRIGLIPLMVINFALAVGFIILAESFIKKSQKDIIYPTLKQYENMPAKTA